MRAQVRAAKAVMHVAAAGAQLQQQPQCRGQQIQELEAIVEAALRDRSGCAIYVSGCPGSVSFFLGFASYKKFLGAYNTINGIGGVCLTDAQYRGQHSKGASLHLRAGISWVLAE